MTTPNQLADAAEPRDWAPESRSRRAFWRARPSPEPWLRVFRQAMACRFEVLLPVGSAANVDAARRALAQAERLEMAWSVFRHDSVVSRLNREAADAPCPIDAELAALLTRCLALSADTDGAFDITATPLSRCWGWLARAAAVPSPDAIAAALASVGAYLVQVRETLASDALQADAVTPVAAATVRFERPGVEVNLGAIGKGYAVGRVAHGLRRAGVDQALVSAGDSSVEAVGAPRGGWEIALRGQAARLRLTAGAMATSGAGDQGIVVDGVRFGHVLDPRTGWPARGVTRVTVVAPDAADADALSTAFLIGGPALVERYLSRHEDVLAVLTLDDDARPRIMGRAVGAVVEVDR